MTPTILARTRPEFIYQDRGHYCTKYVCRNRCCYQYKVLYCQALFYSAVTYRESVKFAIDLFVVSYSSTLFAIKSDLGAFFLYAT